MKKYAVLFNADQVRHFDDLAKAMAFFYRESAQLTREAIDFYEENRLILTWVRGKGVKIRERTEPEYS